MNIMDFKDELILQANETYIHEIIDQANRDIEERNKKITIRDLYDRMGFKSVRTYPDAYLDCWGFDKSGFRQLYFIVNGVLVATDCLRTGES